MERQLAPAPAGDRRIQAARAPASDLVEVPVVPGGDSRRGAGRVEPARRCRLPCGEGEREELGERRGDGCPRARRSRSPARARCRRGTASTTLLPIEGSPPPRGARERPRTPEPGRRPGRPGHVGPHRPEGMPPHHEPPEEVVGGGGRRARGRRPATLYRARRARREPDRRARGWPQVTITRRRTFPHDHDGLIVVEAARLTCRTRRDASATLPRCPIPVMNVAPPATHATARTRPFDRRVRHAEGGLRVARHHRRPPVVRAVVRVFAEPDPA